MKSDLVFRRHRLAFGVGGGDLAIVDAVHEAGEFFRLHKAQCFEGEPLKPVAAGDLGLDQAEYQRHQQGQHQGDIGHQGGNLDEMRHGGSPENSMSFLAAEGMIVDDRGSYATL